MDDRKVTRRDFFANVFMSGSLLAGFGLLAVYMLQFLLPAVRVQPKRKLFVATLDKIPPGKSFKFEDLKGQTINIVNTGDQLVALSTICTHLGCQIHWKENKKQFFCPCHDGYFDAQGKVIQGPPPAPLPAYPVEVVGRAIYIQVDEVWNQRV